MVANNNQENPLNKNKISKIYRGWILACLVLIIPMGAAIGGGGSNQKALGTGMFFTAFVWGYVWNKSDKNKWLGATLGVMVFFFTYILFRVFFGNQHGG